MGSSPPWQLSRQRLHLSQASGSLCSPSTHQRETAPSSAPSGQIERHQSRVTRRLASENGDEQNPQHQALRKVRLAEIEHRELQNRMEDFAGRLDGRDVTVLQRRQHGAHGKVEGGQHRQSEGPDQQAEGIEPADGRRAEDRGHQPGDQHDVFARLPALVSVGLDALLAALGLRGQVADEVLQRAHGADPAAKKAAQKERGQQDDQAPEQPAIERVAGQRIDKGHQRVPLEKQPHRRAQMNVAGGAGRGAQRREDQQRKKQEQKEDLRDSAPQRQPGPGHNSPPHAACGRYLYR